MVWPEALMLVIRSNAELPLSLLISIEPLRSAQAE
jgi:hypothetical protein